MIEPLTIALAELPADLPEIYQIRYQVFQLEQGVAAALEFDGRDEQATHLLARLSDRPVGTARIRYLEAQTAKIERVAVLADVRGRGIGRQLMQSALKHLAAAGLVEARIHAQTIAQTFYERLGFELEGELFEEAGIPHVKMKKLL